VAIGFCYDHKDAGARVIAFRLYRGYVIGNADFTQRSDQPRDRHEKRRQRRAMNIAPLVNLRGAGPRAVAGEDPQKCRHIHIWAVLEYQPVGPELPVPIAGTAGDLDLLGSGGNRAEQD
jgi:hypothetical protein